MYLPEQLQQQTYMNWNHTVKGLMRVWEIARVFGVEADLEERLHDDTDGSIARRLGEIGNDPQLVDNLFQQYLQIAGRPDHASQIMRLMFDRSSGQPVTSGGGD
jgi:hypothetical protein